MWFLSSSALADRFATAVDSFDRYVRETKLELWSDVVRRKSVAGNYPGHWGQIMGHFVWALHLFRTMSGTAVSWAPLQYQREFVIVRHASGHAKLCDPTSDQLLRGARGDRPLDIPRGFTPAGGGEGAADGTADRVPIAAGLRSLPSAATCRANPAFRAHPFGGGRSFSCPMESEACEGAELGQTASTDAVAARFYNVSSGMLLRPPSMRLPACEPTRPRPEVDGPACARALRGVWDCVRRHEARECVRTFGA
jgi:hypothetical protein